MAEKRVVGSRKTVGAGPCARPAFDLKILLLTAHRSPFTIHRFSTNDATKWLTNGKGHRVRGRNRLSGMFLRRQNFFKDIWAFYGNSDQRFCCAGRLATSLFPLL